MGPLNLGSLFLHRCVQLLFVILEINNPCGSGSFRMAAVLHILGKRLLLFWINSQLSWRRCIRSVPFTFSAAAAKLLQSCPTLCDPIDSSLPGSSVPGILQARTLEWVAISFSNAWKWKVKVKSFSRVRLFETPWTAAFQAPLSMGFSRQECWSGVPLPSLLPSLART